MSLSITCSDCFQNYSSEEKLSHNVINEICACVTRACIYGDMVETCIDHRHCLHHDSSAARDFVKF